MGNKSFSTDLNTNPLLHNINTSPIPRETLDEELIKMREENKKLATMLTTLCENYNSLQTHIIELQQKYSTHINEEDMNSKLLLSRKRKVEEECCVNNFEETSPKRPREITTNISTVCVKTNPSDQTSRETLDEELIRMREENKKLVTMLTSLCENYNSLQTQLIELLQKYSTHNEEDNSKLLLSRKRKAEEEECCVNNFEEASPKRPREITTNVSTVCVKTNRSDQTSVVKDGYNWRKYGQKVTRDNPYPRAYYKCSFAPTCPVKKKVQRSIEDPSILVAVYEGEHNHPHPSQAEITVPLVNQDVITTDERFSNKFMEDIDKSSLQQLVEQMASSLTSNPNFTAAVAAAISGKIFEYDLPFK